MFGNVFCRLGVALLALTFGSTSVQAQLGPTPSGFAPPALDGETFVADHGSGLDTGCVIRSAGPLTIHVPVDRYLGPTNPDNTLESASLLVSKGWIGRKAIITVTAWNSTFQYTGPTYQPQRDRVTFNGRPMPFYDRNNSEFLEGSLGHWRVNKFEVPIEYIKFPSARGTNGSGPTPVMNDLVVDIDVLNTPPNTCWCSAVDWVSIEIKTIAPVIFVPGNSLDGTFYTNHGFTNPLRAYNGDAHGPGIQWDNSGTTQFYWATLVVPTKCLAK